MHKENIDSFRDRNKCLTKRIPHFQKKSKNVSSMNKMHDMNYRSIYNIKNFVF